MLSYQTCSFKIASKFIRRSSSKKGIEKKGIQKNMKKSYVIRWFFSTIIENFGDSADIRRPMSTNPTPNICVPDDFTLPSTLPSSHLTILLIPYFFSLLDSFMIVCNRLKRLPFYLTDENVGNSRISYFCLTKDLCMIWYPTPRKTENIKTDAVVASKRFNVCATLLLQ